MKQVKFCSTMKVTNIITVGLLVCTIMCFTFPRAVANREIEIGFNQFAGGSNVYNMRGAELYLSTCGKELFITKSRPFVFTVDKVTDSLIEETSLHAVDFVVVNSSFRIHFSIPKDIFMKYNYFGLTFLQDKNRVLRINLDLGGFGAVIRDARITPNEDWKPKFYPCPD